MNNVATQTTTPTNSADEAKIPASADTPESAPTSVARTPAAKKSMSASAPAPVKKTAARIPAVKVPKTAQVDKVGEPAAKTPAAKTSLAKKSAKESHAVAKAEHSVKLKKEKLVRDSFTMPESEYQALADAKKECLKAGVAIKKSELLRVSIASLRLLSVAQLTAARDGLSKVQAGRPKK